MHRRHSVWQLSQQKVPEHARRLYSQFAITNRLLTGWHSQKRRVTADGFLVSRHYHYTRAIYHGGSLPTAFPTPPRNTSKVCSRVHSSLTRTVVEILHEPVTRQCPSDNFQPPTVSNLQPSPNQSFKTFLPDWITLPFLFLFFFYAFDDRSEIVDDPLWVIEILSQWF